MSISTNPTAGIPASAPAVPAAAKKTIATDKSEKSEKAREAIEKFEGLFMSMMIKQLRETSFGEGMFPNDASDTYGGMFDMFMGDHLAKTADLGIEQLFQSSTALKQLEEHVRPKLFSESKLSLEPGLSQEQRSKGIEEYRNEQFRSGAVTMPSAS